MRGVKEGDGFVFDFWENEALIGARDTARKNYELEDRELAYLERKKKEAELNGIHQDLEMRKRYANKIFWLLTGWLVFIALFLLGSYLNLLPVKILFSPKEVVIALLTTTTITVVGIFMVVARNIFPSKSRT